MNQFRFAKIQHFRNDNQLIIFSIKKWLFFLLSTCHFDVPSQCVHPALLIFPVFFGHRAIVGMLHRLECPFPEQNSVVKQHGILVDYSHGFAIKPFIKEVFRRDHRHVDVKNVVVGTDMIVAWK